MATDARLATGLPAHPKTKKLIKRLGQAAGWNLVCLILWAADNRSDGDLTGMSVEDIELSADWSGEEGQFVAALVAVRFLDGQEGEYLLHDWAEHNPWAAGAESRSAKARWNAAKRHHGIAEADRLVPEYAAIRFASSNASSTETAQTEQQSSNAPSPSPSPSPSPKTLPAAPSGAELLFDEFWATYPRKAGKDAARKAFAKRKPSRELLDQMLASIREQVKTDAWRKDGGQYIPHPATWLNEGRWQDETTVTLSVQSGIDAAEATRREREARDKGAAPPPAHIRAQLASLTKKFTGAMA